MSKPESKWTKPLDDPTMEQLLLLEARREINDIIGKSFYGGIEPSHMIILLLTIAISFALTIAKDDKREEMVKGLGEMFEGLLDISKQSIPAIDLLRKMAEDCIGEDDEAAAQKLVEALKAAGMYDTGDDDGSKS